MHRSTLPAERRCKDPIVISSYIEQPSSLPPKWARKETVTASRRALVTYRPLPLPSEQREAHFGHASLNTPRRA